MSESISDLYLIDLQWFASAEEEGRTEEPTEHKLKKAREEGRVAKSTEISGALVLLLPVIAILMLVVCPVFISLPGLKYLQFVFPVSYYLYAVYDWIYLLHMIVYTFVLLCLSKIMLKIKQ